MSVTVVVSFKVKPDKVMEFMRLLEANQAHMIEAGALSVALLRDIEKPNRVVEIEKWESIEDHKNFAQIITQAAHFTSFEQYLLEPYKVMYLDVISRREAF
jgi:quinol monooxygenase YgiN